MDEDRTPEVILELSADGYPVCYEILNYSSDQVYGYNFVYRGLEQLKTDGSFWASSGAADNECAKLTFHTGSYERVILAYSQSKQDSNGMPISYYINNQPVTKEAYDIFVQIQEDKEDVMWLEYTQSNVENELSNK